MSNLRKMNKTDRTFKIYIYNIYINLIEKKIRRRLYHHKRSETPKLKL